MQDVVVEIDGTAKPDDVFGLVQKAPPPTAVTPGFLTHVFPKEAAATCSKKGSVKWRDSLERDFLAWLCESLCSTEIVKGHAVTFLLGNSGLGGPLSRNLAAVPPLRQSPGAFLRSLMVLYLTWPS